MFPFQTLVFAFRCVIVDPCFDTSDTHVTIFESGSTLTHYTVAKHGFHIVLKVFDFGLATPQPTTIGSLHTVLLWCIQKRE
jgi:hypothetical protein